MNNFTAPLYRNMDKIIHTNMEPLWLPVEPVTYPLGHLPEDLPTAKVQSQVIGVATFTQFFHKSWVSLFRLMGILVFFPSKSSSPKVQLHKDNPAYHNLS